jgi:hypothetical protein
VQVGRELAAYREIIGLGSVWLASLVGRSGSDALTITQLLEQSVSGQEVALLVEPAHLPVTIANLRVSRPPPTACRGGGGSSALWGL